MNANQDPTTFGPITAERLIGLPLPDGRHELIAGELRMMNPAGGRHGEVAMRVGMLLAQHVAKNDLGLTFAAETGFVIARDPDTVRAPDVAFVSNERAKLITAPEHYLPFAPNLAVEVLSPNDSLEEAVAKAEQWLTGGSELVLLLLPDSQQVHAHRRNRAAETLTVGEDLDASDVVPGWRATVGDFFPPTRRGGSR